MPEDYDVEEAFRAIENELLNSMMKNLSHHRAEETKEGYNWTSWQSEQLKALNIYKQKNSKKFTKQFREINDKISKSIRLHKKAGETAQEKEILEAIKKGAKLTHKAESTIEGAFFRVNDRKLDALLNEINGSMRRAETAMLRMANDQYRKVIFNSQVYFNTGAGTYEKAVDMATKDFLSRGINCIQYKNGARVNIASYAGMALRTANTRAYCQGEGAKRQEWGISTVMVNKRGLPCPKCGKWTGKILIDDVWSGGKASDGPYPLMSQAMAGGLYHPNCKDGHSTYFPGISEKPEKVTKKEMKQAVVAEQQENRRNLIQRNVDKFDRLSTYSLDEENQEKYNKRHNEWKKRVISKVDKLNQHKPINIVDIDKEHRENIFKILSNSNIVIQQTTLRYIKDINFINEKTLLNAYANSKGISVNLNKAKVDRRGNYAPVFHEIGHLIDRAKGGASYQNSVFRNSLINDFETVVKLMEKEYNVNKDEVYNIISDNLQEDIKHSISDLVGGITNNVCQGKYGHRKKDYWLRPNQLEKEAFAHFYEAYARNDKQKINLLKQMFPNAVEEFIRLVK